ncbi:LacI family DNA-binding transcriptional regulator [Nakamurella sp. PAMC28650]|uniref:LacI family DNA-binding transcriptional regulator n=1 Tax=Nakamurella sp. PAMC28650 TaxID=2762325 RepID=UPI00164E480C|nr:substrate-binding domain-containing protein [Nakamurella sp. PAMC28650]QNK81147.1 substrate-binding domain-containing protein [Nakamurella sp. PAMC28650]
MYPTGVGGADPITGWRGSDGPPSVGAENCAPAIAAIAAIAVSGVPTVLVNRRTARTALPFVGADDQRGARLCVEHLVRSGHRDIVHLAGPSDTSTGRARVSAFRSALREYEVPPRRSAVIECSGYSEEAGIGGAQRLLDARRSFTAIVAANDLLALGAMDLLATVGLRCPADYSITGFNDLPFMRKLSPPLTTVHVPLTDMGAAAARTLLAWIGTPDAVPATPAMIPVELVVRGTTGPATSP